MTRPQSVLDALADAEQLRLVTKAEHGRRGFNRTNVALAGRHGETVASTRPWLSEWAPGFVAAAARCAARAAFRAVPALRGDAA